MSLFAKTNPERIEPDEPVDDLPKSSRKWKPSETLTVSYQPWMKLLTLLSPLLIVPFFQLFLALSLADGILNAACMTD